MRLRHPSLCPDRPISARIVVAFFALALSPAAQEVFVVDAANGPGTDFVNLPDAVAAATDGDVLLVRTGVYSTLDPLEVEMPIEDKGIAIVADMGQTVELDRGLAVRDLAAGKEVTLSGLLLHGETFFTPPLSVVNCAGGVLVQDCEILAPQALTLTGGDAAQVIDSDAVAFNRCQITGAAGVNVFGSERGEGLECSNSNVSLYDSQLTGSVGVPGSSMTGAAGQQGGAGLYLDGGSAFLSGTTLVGGVGGPGTLPGPFTGPLCSDGGPGGAGLELVGDPTVRLLDSSLAGGLGGTSPDGACSNGLLGTGSQGSGDVQVLGAAARRIAASSPVRDGELATLSVSGEEGDPAFLLFGHGLSPLPFLSAAGGPLWPDVPPAGILFLGTLPVGGQLEISSRVAFGGTSVEFFLQGLLFDPANGFVATNAESMHWLGE